MGDGQQPQDHPFGAWTTGATRVGGGVLRLAEAREAGGLLADVHLRQPLDRHRLGADVRFRTPRRLARVLGGAGELSGAQLGPGARERPARRQLRRFVHRRHGVEPRHCAWSVSAPERQPRVGDGGAHRIFAAGHLISARISAASSKRPRSSASCTRCQASVSSSGAPDDGTSDECAPTAPRTRTGERRRAPRGRRRRRIEREVDLLARDDHRARQRAQVRAQGAGRRFPFSTTYSRSDSGSEGSARRTSSVAAASSSGGTTKARRQAACRAPSSPSERLHLGRVATATSRAPARAGAAGVPPASRRPRLGQVVDHQDRRRPDHLLERALEILAREHVPADDPERPGEPARQRGAPRARAPLRWRARRPPGAGSPRRRAPGRRRRARAPASRSRSAPTRASPGCVADRTGQLRRARVARARVLLGGAPADGAERLGDARSGSSRPRRSIASSKRRPEREHLGAHGERLSPRNSSGAAYFGVRPRRMPPPSRHGVASPRSTSVAAPPSPTMMFAGFTSPWNMPARWSAVSCSAARASGSSQGRGGGWRRVAAPLPFVLSAGASPST